MARAFRIRGIHLALLALRFVYLWFGVRDRVCPRHDLYFFNKELAGLTGWR
jgi:hypothetical protein